MSSSFDSPRTSLALFVVGCVLVGTAVSLQLTHIQPSENEAAAMLTLIVLGGSCFVGNVQAGNGVWKLAGGLGVALGVWAMLAPLQRMWLLW